LENKPWCTILSRPLREMKASATSPTIQIAGVLRLKASDRKSYAQIITQYVY
jgi:hypothetical protein